MRKYDSCPAPPDLHYEESVVNVRTTTKSQKEFLLDLIGQIPDGNLKKEYLEKLKQLILEEDDKTPKFSLDGSSSSLTTIYKQIAIPNPFQQITTKDLQHEINHIKNEIKHLKNEVFNLKTKDLTLEAKLALLQNPPQQLEIPASIPIEISQIAEKEIPTQQFIQNI